MECKTGSEASKKDLLEETTRCSDSDSVLDGTLENLVLDEDREMGVVAVATDAARLKRVCLATGSSSLISMNRESWGMAGRQ